MSELDSVVVDDLAELGELLRSAPEAASLRPIGLREVVRGEGAVRSLPDVLHRRGLEDGTSLVVLSDSTPKRYGDDDVLDVVLNVLNAHFRTSLQLVTTKSSGGAVLADEDTVATAIGLVRHDEPSGLVSVGSGTVVDIAKVVAGALSLTHVVVQSAASVNGFADDQSVLLINGAKRTTPSRWPDALVIDPLVVAHAPLGMTRSGLGDQLSMFTAAADWYLASAVEFDTSYSPTLVEMMRSDLDALMSASSDLGQGGPRAVTVLANCLTRGGLAMGSAGRTAPSSGMEHTISHLLEMHADAVGVSSASHGSQVGVASVFAALAWQRFLRRLAEGSVTIDEQNVPTRRRVLEAFAHLDSSGATALECWNLYQRKSAWILEHLDGLRRTVHDWSNQTDAIDRLLKPAEVVATLLRDARAPVAFHELDPAPDASVVVWAVTNCHLMRDRFSIIDLADLIGAWRPDDVAAVLAELKELAR